jgi:hypothetical protein
VVSFRQRQRVRLDHLPKRDTRQECGRIFFFIRIFVTE